MKTALFIFTLVLISFVVFLPQMVPVFAAPTDGNGPWADGVVSATQGLRKDGSPVLVSRSNPNAAVGMAEDNTIEGNFFSLGFGGNIVLRFDNPISNGVIAVEATNFGYPAETAKVEVSADGTNWFVAGTVLQDGQVSMPRELACAIYVRLTDTSNRDLFPSDADGYDIDGVKAVEGRSCQVPTPPATDCCCSQQSITVSGNGSLSTTVVDQKNERTIGVSQLTSTTVVNTIQTNTKTGKVTGKKNTGGTLKVVTGNALSSTVNKTLSDVNTTSFSVCCECSKTCPINK